MDSSQCVVQTNEKLFFKFRIRFRINDRNRKIFKWIARREYWSNCNVLYIIYLSWQALQTNGKLFTNFKIILFWINNGRKPKNIQTNRDAWILINVQCVVYNWIRPDKLYKLMESRGVSELRIRIRIRGYPHEFWHPYPHPQYFMRMSCGYRK